MNASTFFPALKKLIKRASSLLMLFQRTPAAQILVPAEFNLASSAAFLGTTEFAIATVVGLGAYDSVAGATTLTQIGGSLNVVAGEPFSVTYQVSGRTPGSWRVVGTLPAGLSMPNQPGSINAITGTTTQVGSRSVTVQAWEGSNFNGGVIQKPITINVTQFITNQPAATAIVTGQTATLTVGVAQITSPSTYTFEWFQGSSGDTSTPVGTNAASFTTPVLSQTTNYWVRVTKSGVTGPENSITATVTVRQPAAITTQPVSTSINTGQTASLSVIASGTGPLTYQWYQGTSGNTGTPVGTNSAFFTTPVLLTTTSYWVKVTNAANSTGANSDTATITVTDASDPAIFTAATLPTARTNIPYSTTLTAFGGRQPYTWTLSDGNLPDGFNLSETGVISGTSGGVGVGSFTVQVMDQDMKTDSRVFTLDLSDLNITTASLPTAVKGTPYSVNLSAVGGSEPYSWSIQGGTLPSGITLNSAGVLSGTPTAAGDAAITVRVTDSSTFGLSKSLLLPVSATFIRPVLNPVIFPVATVGADFSYTVTAQNYPRTFTITGLPKGLKATPGGVISGKPDVSGVFNVQVRATNPGGASLVVTSRLTVKALPKNLVGTFGGLLTRNSTTNRSLGGQIGLTVTSTGSYTLRITGALPNTTPALGGSASSSATGRLAATAPQIITTVAGAAVSLSIDTVSGDLSGSVGAATISGHRSAWNAINQPAEDLAGYYSMALDLADVGDDGVITIPQGSGYATFSVTNGGTLAIAGRTADGETITTATFLSSDAEFWAYTPLYKNAGTIQGNLKITPDAQSEFVGNVISGALTWFKPSIPSRSYGTTFGPINLKAEGGYLAPASTGNVVLGLPDTGTVQLRFTDGGLASSVTDPDMDFTYTDDNKVVLPTAANSNPGKVSVTVNATTGAMTGNFTLTEITPPLTRSKVPFQGQVVRLANGQVKAVGYFMLPQIPTSGQTAATATLLSGGWSLNQ